jgi:hypothetical protein
MEKLILRNESDLDMVTFLEVARGVIEMGRISNGGTQYCYLVSFIVSGVEYHLISAKNEKSDTLTLYNVPVHQESETV